MLIEHLRSQHKPPAGYTDVRYWFVTESTRLPTYARFGIDGGGRPDFPFCILSSTWAQLLRAMVPRTSDLNGMVAALLASPFVGYRSAPRGAAQLTAIERITRSIDSLKDVPPAVAIAVVNDKAMSTKIGEETDPVVVEQLIQDAMSAKALELEAQLETAADRVVDAERTRDQAQAARLAAEQERDRLAADRDRAIADARSNRSELETSIGSHRADSETLRGQVENVQKRLDDAEAEVLATREKSRRVRRNAGAIVACLAVNGVGATLIASATVSGVIAVIAVIAVMAAAIYGAVRVISKNMAVEVIAIIAILSGVVTVASLVIASQNHQDSKGSKPASAKSKVLH
jgi:hypothetical protein